MNAGELNQRVVIQTPTGMSDAYGQGAEPTWASSDPVWAKVRPLRASEILRAQQPGMETGYVVKMRYTSRVKPECRLVWQGKTLEITSVIDIDGAHAELEILCNERQAANA